MMRKHLLFYALSCFIAFGVSNCSYYDDPSSPAKSSVTVDKNSGLAGQTEFTFTITQVAAQNISLLPEGDGRPGILISASSFTDGKATVKYTYSDIGTFSVVVKTNSVSPDGKTIKQTVSDAVTVTITNDENKITAFSFAGPNSTSTTIKDKVDSNSDTINVVVPYNPFNTLTVKALKATFTASAFATVKVGSTAQSSGTTANDFSSTVTYTVTSANGVSRTYLVNVTIMTPSTDATVKSALGIVLSKGDLNKKKYNAFVDNTNKIIAIVLPSEADDSMLDSLSFEYELNDTTARGDVKQDKTLSLTGTTTSTLNVTPQSGSAVPYKIYAVIAPKLEITISNLTPQVVGKTSGLAVSLTCLKGTDLEDLTFSYTITGNGSGYALSYNSVAFPSGSTAPSFTSSPKNFVLQVTDKSITYNAIYSVDVLTVQ
jgi:hypothetical protein